MVAPGMLQNLSVRTWLEGVEPAWTLLSDASFHALRQSPTPQGDAIRLSTKLTSDEIHRSAVLRNALILLRAAAEAPGLKLTATGNLSRSVVAEMVDTMSWPDFNKAQAFPLNRVVNEPDYLHLHFLRMLSQSAKLLRRRSGHLLATPLARHLSEEPSHGALLAILFHLVFWHLDISDLWQGPFHGWPQRDCGIVLWSLSVAAAEWQSSKRLTRLCTVPIIGVLESDWDVGTSAMEARILRPLEWFGLVERREADTTGSRFDRRHFYRKTPLFDRFLSFDVTLDETDGLRH